MNLSRFKKTIWDYYKKHGRHDLPWRKTKDPYNILVSEVMLQQTQVPRVIEKYKSFLKKFPSVQVLANAPLKDVLLEWQGLGYNRRAKYLKQCAEKVVSGYGGKFPKTLKELVALPGIGPATAGDILAFAYNIPVPVIETNIRSVFIHFFHAPSADSVSDKDLLPIIEHTLDMKNPKEWYWALFDYGAFLKQTRNPNTQSKHYVKQPPFKGSNREKRSQILKLILTGAKSEKEIVKALGYESEVVQKNIEQMVKENLIKKEKGKFFV
ncbi:MAG: A/G-specific adenine glycosylase [Candidatus Zambryskibacteria bacterium]|nr:A/G-specific adenine glycosylase [Candidatus Zambryskibacteria bacterium]